MKSIEKFNALQGRRVKRSALTRLQSLARKEDQKQIYNRIKALLSKYPDAGSFKITLKQKVTALAGANDPTCNNRVKCTGLKKDGKLKKGYRYGKGGVVKKQKGKKATKKKSVKPKQSAEKKAIKTPVPKPKKVVTTPQKTKEVKKKTPAPEQWKKADTRKSTSLIKKYLLQKYGIKTSVRSEYYSGGSSLRISYVLGPDRSVIEKEVKRLQYGNFDGMTDSYNYKEKALRGMVLEGYTLEEYKYVFAERELPMPFKMKLAKALSKVAGFPDVPEYKGGEKAFTESFNKPFGSAWSWSQLVTQWLPKLNFVTQDEKQITDIKAISDKDANRFYIRYKVKGKVYDSRKPAVYDTAMGLATPKKYCGNRVKCYGIKKDGTLKKGYKFAKGGAVVRAKKKTRKKKVRKPLKKGLVEPERIDIYISEKPKKPKAVTPKEKPQGLGTVFMESSPKPLTFNAVTAKNPLVKNLVEVKDISKTPRYFNLKGHLANFLGRIEKKPTHSVVITLDAPPGAGKTRAVFQMLNMFADAGLNTIFGSLEEHPESQLFRAKANMYIRAKNEPRIDTFGELPEDYREFLTLMQDYDAIAIDSWNKVNEKYKSIDFDRDLRKKLHGKIIVTVFQRTQNGLMRGGSKASFDGDIILEIESKADFRESYLTARKNRYQNRPLNTIGYNIYYRQMVNLEVARVVPHRVEMGRL